jgi:hypothetical protein
MSEKDLKRPRQVTIAVGMGLFGCLIFVIALFDAMAATYSLAAHNAITELLTQPPYDGMGLSVEEMLHLLRVVIYGMGAAAAVGFVLSFYTYQRSNAARIAFTAAALCLVPGLLGPEGIGVAAIIVGFAAVGLWSEPARDWFAGRAPRPPAQALPSPPVARTFSPDQPPPAAVPFGTPPPPPPPPAPARVPQAARPAPSPAELASYAPPQPVPGRPRALLAAVRITRVFTILAALVLVGFIVEVATSRATYEADFRSTIESSASLVDFGVTPHQLWVSALLGMALMVAWCALTFALTFFVVRRAQWARILLIVSAGGAALVSLIGILAIVPVFTLMGSAFTIYLLLKGEVAAWFAGPNRPPANQPPGRSHPW